MNYIETIKTAIFIFPLIAFLFTIPFILSQYHKYGSINKFRVLIIYSFILYLMTIYFLVILPLPTIEEVRMMPDDKVQLIPFYFVDIIRKSTSFNISNPHTYLSTLCNSNVYPVLFNIVMTIPLGMYLRYYFKCSLKKTVVISFLLSLFFELTQLTGLYFIYPKPYRFFDVDDLIMNTLGGFIGYFLVGVIDNFLPTRDEIDEKSTKAGEMVSGLRRITLFCLDFLLYTLLIILSSILFNFTYMAYIIFFIYYVLIPYFCNGKTLAGSFLNVKLEFSDNHFLRLLVRAIYIFLYYFGLVFVLEMVLANLADYLHFSSNKFMYLVLFSFIVIFYFVHLFLIWKNRTVYYDRFIKVNFKSTINEEEK